MRSGNMTHKRFNYLLLSIICFLACLLIISTARAEWHAAGYVTGIVPSGNGYDPGIGGLVEASYRYKWAEVKVHGSGAWQKKHRAEFGYTWAAGAEGRGYIWNEFYLVGAYTVAGYKSTFKDGDYWQKWGHNGGLGAGYNNGTTDINLIYMFQETGSPNNVQYTSCNLRQHIWKWLWGMSSIKYMTYDQPVNGVIQRLSAWVWTLGLGVRW